MSPDASGAASRNASAPASSGKKSRVRKLKDNLGQSLEARDQAIRELAGMQAQQDGSRKEIAELKGMIQRLTEGQAAQTAAPNRTDRLFDLATDKAQFEEDGSVNMQALTEAVKQRLDTMDQRISGEAADIAAEKALKTVDQRMRLQNLESSLIANIGPEIQDRSSAIYRAADAIGAQIKAETGELTPRDYELAFYKAKALADRQDAGSEHVPDDDAPPPEALSEGGSSGTVDTVTPVQAAKDAGDSRGVLNAQMDRLMRTQRPDLFPSG